MQNLVLPIQSLIGMATTPKDGIKIQLFRVEKQISIGTQMIGATRIQNSLFLNGKQMIKPTNAILESTYFCGNRHANLKGSSQLVNSGYA